MRGAVLYGPRDVRFEERETPKIMKPTDAVIRISATCVCGSDLWPYRGIQPIAQPTPMGHEYCGIVEEVGNAVTRIKPGQFVIGSFFASDNTCPNCQIGYQSSCQHSEFVGGAQAPLLRVPLADGTLVATRDVSSENSIPNLLALSDVMGTGWFAADAANVKPGKTAKTRERIVKAAGAEFAANGISEAALARVMAAAGLTHGGFYRHFASKDQLVLEACRKTLLSLIASLELLINGKPHEQALPLLVDHYVSRAHRDQPRTGCPLAALGSELARRDKRTRHAAIEGFLQLSRLIAGHLDTVPFRKRAERSMAIVSAMVGAVTLARIAPDSRISDSVLVATRDYIIRSVRRQR